MKAFNWYYRTVRHTRSDRSLPREVTIDPHIDGFELHCQSDNKSMRVKMSDAEIDLFIEKMTAMRDYAKSN